MKISEQTEVVRREAQGRLASMGNYHRWILRNLSRGLGRRIWDAGAGVGVVSSQLLERTDFLLATDYRESHIDLLSESLGTRPGLRVERCDLTRPDLGTLRAWGLDTIINLDVLEHLPDDRAVLGAFHEVLAPGGRLLLKVPAHPFLFGSLDEASLNYRRYTRRDLREKLRGAGFEIERLRHMNLPAVLPYFLKSRVMRSENKVSNSLNGSRQGLYNKLIPWFAKLERFLPPPMGLSLVAIARKAR